MINTIKQNKKAVLAFLLALVMLIGLIPFTATEAHAMTIEANGDVTWKKDDSLTLYLANKDDPTKTETHTVTYDGEKWSTFKSAILPAYAFAHIGEVKDIEYKNGEWSYTPVLKSGYNVLPDLADADVMVATSEVVAGTDLSLNFKHCFSKVSFHCWPNTEFEGNTDITGISVSVGDNKSIIAYREADAFEAIIAPRAYAEGEFFATVTVNSGNGVSMELTVKVPESGLTFEAGKHYTFNITVGKDKVEIDTITVNGDFPGGWENEVNLNADADVTVGTPDQGKTQWEKGDLLAFDFTSDKYGDFLCGVKYENNAWSSTIYPIGKIMTYLENETPTVNAIYSPHYTLNEMGDVNAGSPNNSGGNSKGKYEFIEIGCTLSGETITADFTNATRNYSRLRIATLPNRTLRIGVANFIPAGSTTAVANGFYDLTSDANGNAFLYGTFAEGGSIRVHDGENYIEESGYAKLAEHTFNAPTEQGKSYVLDALPKINIAFTEAEAATGYYEIKDLMVAATCDLYFECKNTEQQPGGFIPSPASIDYEIKISAIYTDQNGDTQVLTTTDWIDNSTPNDTEASGDEEETSLSVTQKMLTEAGVQSYSFVVEVRSIMFPDMTLDKIGQVVHITGSVTN